MKRSQGPKGPRGKRGYGSGGKSEKRGKVEEQRRKEKVRVRRRYECKGVGVGLDGGDAAARLSDEVDERVGHCIKQTDLTALRRRL